MQNRDPQLTPLPPGGDLWEQKGFSTYASAFEEIPLTRFEKLTSDSGDRARLNTPAGLTFGRVCPRRPMLSLI